MKTALIALTLLGCDCGGTKCVVIDHASMTWRTMEACDQVLDHEVRGKLDADCPLIEGVCAAIPTPGERMFADADASDAAAPVVPGASSAADQSSRDGDRRPSGIGHALLVRASDGYVVARKTVTSTLERTGDLARDGALWIRHLTGI